jgi:hypothetical protein
MTEFGDIPTDTETNLVLDRGFVEQLTQQDTTNDVGLEDIPGVSFTLTLDEAGSIMADLTVNCSKNGGGVTIGGWAVSINGVDGAVKQRSMGANNEAGSADAKAYASLAAGTWTVTGRHYRVSGTGTVQTLTSQLTAVAYID